MLKVGLLARSMRLVPSTWLKGAVSSGQAPCFYFSKSELKLDVFEKTSDNFRKYLKNLESCKQKVRRQVDGGGQASEPVSVEDLNLLLYLAKTDEDVELFRKALIKYVQANPDGVYRAFGSLFIRMLICLNKTEKALEIYSCQELRNLFLSDKYAILPLLDKLVDAKRYDDLSKLITYYIDHFDIARIPSTHLNCLTLTLYKKGTKEAYDKMKSLLKRIEERTDNRSFSMGIGSLVHVFLASIEQNDLQYSFDIMLKSKRVHKTLFRNMATIAFAKYDQIQEAFVYAESIPRLETSSNSANSLNEIMGYVFPLTLKALRDSITKRNNNAELLSRYDALVELVKSRNRLFGKDIDDYFTQTYRGIYSSHFTPQPNRLPVNDKHSR